MTGVYTTNTTEAVAYQLKHSRANIAVVDSEAQLQKVLAVRDKLPDLRHSGFSAFGHDNLPKNVYTLKHHHFTCSLMSSLASLVDSVQFSIHIVSLSESGSSHQQHLTSAEEPKH